MVTRYKNSASAYSSRYLLATLLPNKKRPRIREAPAKIENLF